MRLRFALPIFACLYGCSQAPHEATPPPSSAARSALTSTITALDNALFAAFNAHDADRLGAFFTSDLEFYHDKTGLAGYDSTMAGFQRMFTQAATADMHREMVPGTLEVYALGDFGALEVCQHRFCHTENSKEECGAFKNIMVWRKEGSAYKVSRVISYHH